VRIAAFPKGELDAMVATRTKTVFDWIGEARRSLPVDGLELHPGFFWSMDDDFVDRVGDALTAAGFQMPMMCASPDFTHPNAAVRARELDRQAKFMRITRHLGGPGSFCRVLSGQAHPGVPVEQGLEWARTAIESVLPLARELGITVAIENHYKASTWQYPEFAQRADVFFSLIDAIEERACFGVQFDPSNAIVAGEDPARFLERVVDRVVSMQASDRYLAPGTTLNSLKQADGTIGYSADLMHGVIGQGLNDYDEIFRILTRAGYDGWISIEDGVNGIDELRRSADFLIDARDRWFGGSTAVHVAAHEAACRAAERGPAGGETTSGMTSTRNS
jgi:sugar phosphate isomerase/epimerase